MLWLQRWNKPLAWPNFSIDSMYFCYRGGGLLAQAAGGKKTTAGATLHGVSKASWVASLCSMSRNKPFQYKNLNETNKLPIMARRGRQRNTIQQAHIDNDTVKRHFCSASVYSHWTPSSSPFPRSYLHRPTWLNKKSLPFLPRSLFMFVCDTQNPTPAL